MAEKHTIQPVLGKDIIYICQNPSCNKREKEFAMVDRQYKYCSSCGNISIKSTLCGSFAHVVVDEPMEEDFDE